MSVMELSQLFELTGIDYLFNPHKRVYWLFILTSVLLALLYVLFYEKNSIKHYLTSTYWFHSSAKLDYAYFFLISIIKIIVIFPLMLGVSETAFFVLTQLNNFFGYHQAINLKREYIILLYTFVLFISGDFTRYWLHRWLHSSNILWQFHKIHHSAEVLTPATFYRVHPVENFIFGLRYALTTGAVTGVFIYFFGARLQIIDLLGVNFFIFFSLLLGANLRHSPIYFRYPGFLEKWLISPAQHQYHHTAKGARKNYAGVLAIWDRLFGSLFLSDAAQPTNFGLPVEQETSAFKDNYTSLSRLILNPFINIQFIIKNLSINTETK